MDTSILEFKRKLLETGIFRKANGDGQYRCKSCPYCGDTRNHMYVLIRMDDSPVLTHCFKCNSGGTLDEKFLSYFGIDGMKFPRFNRKKKIQPGGADAPIVDLFESEKDRERILLAQDYIEHRVGMTPSEEDLKRFQWIGNPLDYATAYLGTEGLRNPMNRIWFRLTNGGMIGRGMHEHDEWRKYTGTTQNVGKTLYTIKKEFDLFQTVNVCIVEGVMDAIGLYYLQPLKNPVYVACLGRDYNAGAQYLLDAGIFGDSVQINVFKDSDVKRVSLNPKLTQFFKRVNVYHNAIGKDYGVPVDEVVIEKCLEE